jgi:hypothetical protein
MSEEVDNTPDPKIEQTAREMGWHPKEEWKGNPDAWVSAEEFVDRGEKILPILRANNRDLRENVLTLKQQNDRLAQELNATRTIVQNLEKHFTESTKRQLADQRKALVAELRGAVEDRDVDRELAVREQLDDLSKAEREAQDRQAENKDKLRGNPPPDSPDTVNVDPAFAKWVEDNSWFKTDKKRARAVVRAAEDLRDEGDTSTGIEFYNKALERAEGKSNETPPVDKVNGGHHGTPSSSSGPKGWAQLPKEAKDACLADEESFVGEGKLCKTLDEWKAYYVKTYFGS